MRLVFVHDGPIYYDNDCRYYEYSYHGLYNRYRYLADEIVFVMRTYPLVKGEQYDEVPEEVCVVGFENYKSPSLYFKNVGRVKKIIEAETKKADMLVLRNSSAASIAVKYANKYSKPYIWECVGCTWDSMWNYSLLGKILAPWSFLRQRKNIRTSPYVYYVTERFLQTRYPTSGKQIGCSNVVISDIDNRILQERLKKINRINNKAEIVIGTAAAIDVRYKGQEYVIEAMSLLKKNGLQIKYYLAGGNRSNSHYLEECAKKFGVEEDVVFCGSLNNDAITKFYDGLDIYIQPSKTEGLPRSIIEAMSRGCPVLGSNIAGIPELIDNDCLFKVGNPEEIAIAVERLLHQNIKEVAKRNFHKAKEYTSEKLEDKRQSFYDAFLDEYFRRK